MAIDFDALMGSVKDSFKSEKKTYETKEKDTRFIKVTRDEQENGQLVLRLIPDTNGLGVVKIHNHWGKLEDGSEKRYFVENCPTTISGGKCPYCEAYVAAWKNGDEHMKELLKPGKRSERYISNVVVIKDPAHPENNGKVMLFEYGFMISKLIQDALNGDPDAEVDPLNVYHPIYGANLHVKMSRKGQFIVNDGTKFLTPSALIKDMSEFDAIHANAIDLSEFIDPKLFDTYSNLEKKFFKYINGYDPVDGKQEKASAPKTSSKPAPAPVSEADLPWEDEPKKTPAKTAPAKSAPAPVEDDDDFFSNL